MTCRENKMRSVLMALQKQVMRALGRPVEDYEVQSAIHEAGHQFSQAPNPTREELMQVLRGLRQQIVNSDKFTDAEKYRPANGPRSQTGLVTRLDQELERIRTGKDENGRPLRPEQLNLGKHIAGVQRMSEILAEKQDSTNEYLTVYARHMGVPLDEARSRYEKLVHTDRALRDRTHISLQDTSWQDGLKVAGLSASAQSNLTQSNQARWALETMETERRGKVASLPSRPSLQPKHRRDVLSSSDPAVKLQCAGCGQFGHTQDGCPFRREADTEREQARRLAAAQDTMDKMTVAFRAKKTLAQLDAGETVSNLSESGQRINVRIDADTITPGDTNARRILEADNALIEASVRKHRAAEKELADAKAAHAEAAAELEAVRGPIPHVSSFVQSYAYNPDAGVLEVTTRPYTLKTTGEERPAKSYYYKMDAEEFAQLEASPKFSHDISSGVFASGRNGNRYKFESDADMEAALTQRQCPSCGHWATLNSSHQCPVTGDGGDNDDWNHRMALSSAREQSRLMSLPSPVPANVKVEQVRSRVSLRMPGKVYVRDQNGAYVRDTNGRPKTIVGQMQLPDPAAVKKARGNGSAAVGEFGGNFLGGTVKGRVTVWSEPGTGTPLYHVSNVRCSCGKQPCEHATAARTRLSLVYGRAVETSSAAGGRNFATPEGNKVAVEQIRTEPHELLPKIRARRAEQMANYVARYAGQPAKMAITNRPVDTTTGRPVTEADIPPVWQTSDGRQVAVGRDAGRDVAAEVRQRLAARTSGDGDEAPRWRVHVDRSGGVWVRPPVATRDMQTKLQEAFGLPSRPGQGVYIAPDRASQHHMLDRLAGQQPRYSLPGRMPVSADNMGLHHPMV